MAAPDAPAAPAALAAAPVLSYNGCPGTEVFLAHYAESGWPGLVLRFRDGDSKVVTRNPGGSPGDVRILCRLQPGEILIDPEVVTLRGYADLRAAGLVEPLGREVRVGWTDCPVVRLLTFPPLHADQPVLPRHW